MVQFREAAGHMKQASTACTWMGSAMPNLMHWDQLTHPEKWNWEAEAVHEAWDR